VFLQNPGTLCSATQHQTPYKNDYFDGSVTKPEILQDAKRFVMVRTGLVVLEVNPEKAKYILMSRKRK
jgi:hypothetical protein